MELNCGRRMVVLPILIVIGVFLLFIAFEVSGENSPPSVTLLSPSSGQSVENPITVEWEFSDDDDDFVSFDIYLDSDPNPSTLVLNSSSITEYDADTLTRNVTYFWKVIASDGKNSTESETWNFTVVNSPPEIILWHPDSPYRSDSIYEALVWLAYDYDDDALQYHVYLEPEANPSTLVGITDKNKFYPPPLAKGLTYHWKVIATDGYESTESSVESFTVSQTANEFPGANTGYRTYRRTNEKIDSGGVAYGFRMYRNNTLDVDISVWGGNADFYLVKGEYLVQWQWGGRNDTVDYFTVGTKFNCTSVSYKFTAPEAGLYCVIIDDSSMGVAPCVDDPDTYDEETLSSNSVITMDNPVTYSPPTTTDPPDRGSEYGSSFIEKVIGMIIVVGFLGVLLFAVIYLLRNESKKQNLLLYEGEMIGLQPLPPRKPQTTIPSIPVPAHHQGQIISDNELPPPPPVDAIMRDPSGPSHPWNPSQFDPPRDGQWMSALSKVVGPNSPPPPSTSPSPAQILPTPPPPSSLPHSEMLPSPPFDRSGTPVPDELLPTDPELEE